MSVGEIVAIVIASITGIGLISTWIRNGRQNTQDRATLEANLKAEIKDIQDDVKHPDHGLSAIKKKVEEQVLYCARTSTLLKEKIDTLEKKSQ